MKITDLGVTVSVKNVKKKKVILIRINIPTKGKG